MEDYLQHIINIGEDGNIYRCIVLKTDNQKLKVRDAWTWDIGKFFNTDFMY